jgi:cellulose synthase/poly-beta-1,6-N-acetylglucosamine synthase-like glycosyltransferase
MLGLSFAALFLLGHRVRRCHWLLSLLTALAFGSLVWVPVRLLLDPALPFGSTMVVTMLLTAGVTATFERWNALGHLAFSAAVATAAAFLSYAAYVVFTASLGPWSFAFGLLLLLLQMGALVLLLASTFETVDVVCRTRWLRPSQPVRVPGYAPRVSLHVPIHNEPPELVIGTLKALSALDHPDYEVLIIDNNTADESLWRPVEEYCATLGPRFRFFHLMPWPGYKSGALNFALEQTDPAAEIVGIVDADYVVEPDYLQDLVGLFHDPEVAFVQTPQDYRDVAERGRFARALYLSYLYFFAISMASRNEYNGIIFCGTMGLIRRRALEEVGGWNEWCITEDAELSLRLLAAGYTSHFIDRTYGRGLMPLDYAGLKKQRYRWAFGGMQILRMHAGQLFGSRRTSTLTALQRVSYINGGLQWLSDPLTFAFTMLLLIGGGVMFLGGSLFVQPLVGAVLCIPLLFIMLAMMRFLWALRVRTGCTWREALDALSMLMGLTWVVTVACLRGLTSRKGVFLRTPKAGEQPRLRDTVRIVSWELSLGVVCLLLAVGLLLQPTFAALSARGVTVCLLFWQAFIYLSAVRSSLWNYEEWRSLQPRTPRFSPRSLGPALRRLVSDRGVAARNALVSLQAEPAAVDARRNPEEL